MWLGDRDENPKAARLSQRPRATRASLGFATGSREKRVIIYLTGEYQPVIIPKIVH
jgi:hypothetical protein